MRNYLLLFLLIFSVASQAQTYPVNPTPFGKISINTNLKQNNATRVLVQDSVTKQVNWVLKSSFATDSNVLHKSGDTFLNSTDFDPLLSQDQTTLLIKKRDLQPESTRLNNSYIPIYAWGDSMTADYLATPFPLSYPTILTSQLGNAVTNKGVGGETSTQIRTRMIADAANYSKSVIIWAGRNNFSDPTTVKADIAAMIAALGHTRYLVLGIMNSSNGPIGTTQYNQIISLNSDLKAIYGIKYVPIREIVVSAYNPSIPQDVTDFNNDVPPTSLRVPSDPLHLNTSGNTIVSNELFKRLGILYNSNGYMQGKDFEGYLQNSTSVIHTTGNETKSGVLTLSSSPIISSETASTIASFDATKNIKSLPAATYPSLTELSYGKGVTSSIQTQLNGKQNTLTNPVTGTGTNGWVAFWNATNTQSGSANFQWDNTNKRLGINVVSTPQSSIDVRSEGIEKPLNVTRYSNTLTEGAIIQFLRTGGTKAAPTLTLANSVLGGLTSAGYEGVAAGALVANLKFYAKQDFTTTNQPTFVDLETTPVGSIVPAVRLRIDSDGRALFGTTTNNGVDQVQITGTASATVDATANNQLVRYGQVSSLIGGSLLTTTNQSFAGIKSSTNTGATQANAIVLNNSGTNQDGVLSVSTSSTGTALNADGFSSGNVIVANGGASATGFLYVGKNNGTNTFTIDKLGNVGALKFVKAGATSSDVLLGDGTTTVAIANTNTSASTLTLLSSAIVNYYVFGGTTATWTLPTPAGSTTKKISLINTGTGTVTVNTNAGANVLYNGGSTTNTYALLMGVNVELYSDGTKWIVL